VRYPLNAHPHRDGTMKIRRDCAEIREARLKKRLSNWHDWYAWFPVRVNPRELRWLCKVQRRGKYFPGLKCWSWEYQAIY
jgi:hypothetical protein